MAMSVLYAGWGDSLAVTALFAGLAFLLLFRLRWSVLRTLGSSALLGAAIHIVATG